MWDILSVICIILELILNPLHAFLELWPRDEVAFLAVTEVILLSFWTLDILVSLRTAVFTNGSLDFRQHMVLRRYAEGWLIFDLRLGSQVFMLFHHLLKALKALRDVRIYVMSGWLVIAVNISGLRLWQIALRLLRLARLNRVLEKVEGQLMSDVAVANFNISTLSIQILSLRCHDVRYLVI